jgi:hypothetical protein
MDFITSDEVFQALQGGRGDLWPICFPLYAGIGSGRSLQRRVTDVYRSLGFPGADDLRNMFQFKCDFNDIFCGARNVDLARALNPSLQTFDAWFAQNTGRYPACDNVPPF